MKARLICGLCERATHISNVKGSDIIVVCQSCMTELRRELTAHCEAFRMVVTERVTYRLSDQPRAHRQFTGREGESHEPRKYARV
jgi:hypothetical protein